MVAMRLHSGILAATAGTPAVVIDYDPKTRAFAAQTGQTAWTVDVDHLGMPAARSGTGAAAVFEAITATIGRLPARRAALARTVAPLRGDAGRTAGLAVQLAATGSASVVSSGAPGGL